ncbi:Gfo/Idh/MocA family protein [Harryflintia acetispora]|uniref:Gfo/Idh/MocA family protein n=1 Tax=Harryflintia acetispora TaxID=1849041 RepID=UPI00189B8BD3|nr:Gfo/Idh/MocA family oxidoreductase [Harryflintia acetispora]
MKLGILGAADIAYRRFLPALQKCPDITYAGVASRSLQKGQKFADDFGGKVYESYDALLQDSSVDAVYLPLPPALHYEWGKKVLQSGKHLLMEKPFTISLEETETLLTLAKEKELAVHENYMFLYHSQLKKIKKLISDGELGNIRLYRMAFGFPKRAENDFRYNKALGGGALLDCGGYPVRLALELLGDTTRVVQASLSQPTGYEVDLFGSAVVQNEDGLCAQISFGMDNSYKCELEVWGSKATLIAPRIFTAGAGVFPDLIIRSSSGKKHVELAEDDQFLHSIEYFALLIKNTLKRKTELLQKERQAKLISQIEKQRDICENSNYWSE